MKLFLNSIAVIFASIILSSISLAVGDRLGEEASYTLVKGERTSGMIKKGNFDSSIIEYIPQLEKSGAVYVIDMEYDLYITFVGRKKGADRVKITEEYFKPEFMKRLRKEGVIETPDFKVKHLGYGDVKTKSKEEFKNCDKIVLYDFPNKPKSSQLDLIEQFIDDIISYGEVSGGINLDPDFSQAKYKDLSIRGMIYNGVPVLGAVQVDIKGSVSGFSYKAGFDIKEQSATK